MVSNVCSPILLCLLVHEKSTKAEGYVEGLDE